MGCDCGSDEADKNHPCLVATKPFDDQKPGTSGLRKQVSSVLAQENYLENFVQSIFDTLGPKAVEGSTLIVGGDGRYHNDVAITTILQMCNANKVKKVFLGEKGLLSTPALSHLIRKEKALGGILLTASHNPGGPEGDFGIKYNCENGGPAPENITDGIFEVSKALTRIMIDKQVDIKPDQYAKPTTIKFKTDFDNELEVEVVDCTEAYVDLMKTIFDFDKLKSLVSRDDFKMKIDGMHGVAGPYAQKIFVDELGASADSLDNCVPSTNFGGGHPDPNLTWAEQLRDAMGLDANGIAIEDQQVEYDFGAAFDGDADRNMILGKKFFVTPSDSVAAIAAYAKDCIPYFKDGVKGIARSMPTSKAADAVAKKLGCNSFETPTGWKFFGSLMDATEADKKINICGEESFGTGADHVREKDGLWAALAWLSILAHFNEADKPLLPIGEIMTNFWGDFGGRVYYQRLDFEGRPNAEADEVFKAIVEEGAKFATSMPDDAKFKANEYRIFSYEDPVTKAKSENQGWIFDFEANDAGKSDQLKYKAARAIFRKSGTGSKGVTIRMYLEVESENQTSTATEMCQELREIASKLAHIGGAYNVLTSSKADKPDVVT